ncbi:MAG: transglutaminase family protein [Chromatiaceae bacterium]|nr:transglutaminase family protein [Chromatiaceae bacterium]
MDPHLDAALAAHDRGVADAGLDIWVGAEPTFTLRHSESPEWLSEPLGGDKFAYALRMAAALQRRHPGSVVLRSVGRQYAAEKVPRWSVGLLERRDHSPLWGGPPDPFDGSAAVHEDQLDTLWEALAQEFGRRGLACMRLRIADPLGRRLLAGTNVTALDLAADDPRLARPSVHAHKTPPEGLSDPLAADGRFLFSIGSLGVGQATVSACIELPACPDVPTFLGWLAAIQDAANLAGLDALVVQGFPPPVDASLAWTTITPDPAVVEVNQAPQPDVGQFLAAMRELFEVAQQLGLSPYRLQYNGTMSDSGGGGQFTLGGPSAAASPFFVQPALLPRLVRYFNRHPALSYLFAPDYVGSASQSPRADEGTRDAFRELHVALGQLQRRARPTAEFLWASLAPFLADPSGNAHRSELNIEKLCNPYLPGRGRLGLVEFRAFRMPVSPQRAAAVAALLRAIATMLCAADPVPGLRDWGDALHDQYALPFFLRQDLRSVFRDLETQGPGLDASVQHVLLDDAFRPRWTTRFEGCELTIERAVEFWPLVGDVASQEGGGSRMVDSSTTRLQLCLRSCAADGPALHDWRVQIAGIGVPLRAEQDENGAARLIGVRYRDFVPWRGLHPAIGPLGPLHLTLSHPELSAALAMTLHNWHPEGQPYDGLPATPEAAAERLAERLVVRRIAGSAIAVDRPAPEQALSAYTLDLRLCDLAAD